MAVHSNINYFIHRRAPPPRLLETNNERSQPQTRQDSQSRAPQVLSQHFGFVQDQEFNSQQEYDERERRDIRFACMYINLIFAYLY